MKKIAFLLLSCCLLCISCKEKDKIVAQYHQSKFYLSELNEQMPSGLSTEDSVNLAKLIIDDWITDQIILEDAEKTLKRRDKNFRKELNAYRNTLIRQKYFETLTADSKKFAVRDAEVKAEIDKHANHPQDNREIVQLNYVKMSPQSALYKEMKSILFDEKRRMTEKKRIETLCGDSLEYFIEDDKWLFWNDIHKEIPIDFTGKDKKEYDYPFCFEKKVGKDSYLVVILAYKSQQTGEESQEYFESIRTMLVQKKKTDFINQHITQLTKQKLRTHK